MSPRSSVVFGLVLVVAALLLVANGTVSLVQGNATAASAPPCNNSGGPTGCFFTPPKDSGGALAALDGVTKPEDPQLAVGGPFIRDDTALVQLGKALFWDQQAGSDGQACASCHFSAGADARTKNQVSPGLKANPADTTFQIGNGPNHELEQSDFPTHKLADRTNRTSQVARDSNDVVSSAGVFYRTFTSTPALSFVGTLLDPDGGAPDTCTSVDDPVGFNIRGINVRRDEPRNTPTVIDAAFNERNFWDGRAQDVFNGVSPFGARDTNARVYRSATRGTVAATAVRIQYASVASQSVGPPTSSFEMSCDGRTFPDIGHKLVRARPLAMQDIDPHDSVLGPLTIHGAALNRPVGRGLALTYEELIRRAFQPAWWDSPVKINIDKTMYGQMEANFSLFWGLSIQAYVETLVADQTPVDRFLAGDTRALTNQQQRGLNIFQSFQGTAPDPLHPDQRIAVTLANGEPADARCITCHGGPETTNASIDNVYGQRLERMMLRNGTCAIYDQGYLNTGVRPSNDDINLAAQDPFGYSFAETQLAQDGTLDKVVPTAGTPPYGLNVTGDPNVVGPPLGGTSNCENSNIVGAFKVPQLRNVELTGPYFHNGGQLTLMQVVDFYNRGGDFNNPDIDENIHQLHLRQADEAALVAFLVGFTDDRVAYERAPFDHPSLCVADGEIGSSESVKPADRPLPGGGTVRDAADNRMCIPAVGAGGHRTRLKTFLNANPMQH